MKVITNKGFRLILFIAGFVGILFAFLASFAAVARFELFSSKVNKDSNYYISESMKNELMEGLLNQQNWAKNKSELRNIELDNHKIDGIECYYRNFSKDQTEYLLDVCKKYNLFV